MRTVSLRAAAAALGALLLLLGAGSIVATRTLAAEMQDARVGWPRLGDHAVYQGAAEGADDRGFHFRFMWNDSASLPDRWGNAVQVDRAEVERHDGTALRYGYAGGDPAPFLSEDPRGDKQGNETRLDGNNVRQFTVNRSFVALKYAPVWEIVRPAAMCAIRGGYQGLAFAEIARLSPDEFCPGFVDHARSWIRDSDPRVSLEVGDPRRADGVLSVPVTLRAEGEEDDLHATFWLAPGLAYPIAIQDCEPGGDCPSGDAARLVGFEPGDGAPVARHGVVLPEGRPASEFGPSGPDGITDGRGTGFDLPDALAAARSDAGEPLATWLREHPDATLVSGSVGLPEGTLHSRSERLWYLHWKAEDGSERAAYVEREGGCKASLFPSPALGLPVCRHAVSEVDLDEAYPHYDLTPAGRAMTIAAALARFQAERHEADASAYHARFTSFSFSHSDPAASEQLLLTVYGATRTPTGDDDGIPFVSMGDPMYAEKIAFDAATGAVASRHYTDRITMTVAEEMLPADLPVEALGERAALSAAGAAAVRIPSGVPVAAFAAGAALLGAGLGWRLPAGLVLLYTRLTRRDVMDHPRRAAIRALLERSPGLSTGEISQAVGLGSGVARHHLHVLLRAGVLARLEAAGYARYFLVGQADYARCQQEAVLMGGGAEARALDALRRRPGLRAAELARELGVSRPAAHYTLRRLAQKGLVESKKEGARTLLYARLS
ncbi:MAG TPA: helix-turn-helix domain-containing protein [Candidatus Thermoplasmatota archaeon]|nr:helix-turn-helix domain-containing protein [Candidatus Thermoplasmatota archaeon]